MAKLGRRERAKLRRLKAEQRALIAANLSSPPERGVLTSSVARDTLRTHSHTPGFHEPNGGLAKMRVERAKVAAHRFVFVRNGQTWGGCDAAKDIQPMWARYRDNNLACRVIDTRPWLDRTGKTADLIRRLNYRTV